jgi:hypothetical protein
MQTIICRSGKKELTVEISNEEHYIEFNRRRLIELLCKQALLCHPETSQVGSFHIDYGFEIIGKAVSGGEHLPQLWELVD